MFCWIALGVDMPGSVEAGVVVRTVCNFPNNSEVFGKLGLIVGATDLGAREAVLVS